MWNIVNRLINIGYTRATFFIMDMEHHFERIIDLKYKEIFHRKIKCSTHNRTHIDETFFVSIVLRLTVFLELNSDMTYFFIYPSKHPVWRTILTHTNVDALISVRSCTTNADSCDATEFSSDKREFIEQLTTTPYPNGAADWLAFRGSLHSNRSVEKIKGSLMKLVRDSH